MNRPYSFLLVVLVSGNLRGVLLLRFWKCVFRFYNVVLSGHCSGPIHWAPISNEPRTNGNSIEYALSHHSSKPCNFLTWALWIRKLKRLSWTHRFVSIEPEFECGQFAPSPYHDIIILQSPEGPCEGYNIPTLPSRNWRLRIQWLNHRSLEGGHTTNEKPCGLKSRFFSVAHTCNLRQDLICRPVPHISRQLASLECIC